MDFTSFLLNPPESAVRHPNPVLRTVALPILHIDETVGKVAELMFDLMYRWKGVGLSAPQVGLPYRMFVINPTGSATHKDKEQVFINPEIISLSNRKVSHLEGCLSLPGVTANVSRSCRILFTAQDLTGKRNKYGYEGLTGRVISHETDHLNGILICDVGEMTESAKVALVALEAVPVIEECNKGRMTESLKRLYLFPTRNYVDWSLFPSWARPDSIFDEASHEG